MDFALPIIHTQLRSHVQYVYNAHINMWRRMLHDIKLKMAYLEKRRAVKYPCKTNSRAKSRCSKSKSNSGKTSWSKILKCKSTTKLFTLKWFVLCPFHINLLKVNL